MIIIITHIPSRHKSLTKAIFKSFKGVDEIIHAKDFEELSVTSTLEELAPLTAVQGNIWYTSLKRRFPEKKNLQVEELLIGITHSSGRPSGYIERVLKEFSTAHVPNIIVCGHTHQPIAQMIKNILLRNAYSPTNQYITPLNTVALISNKRKLVQTSIH